MLPTHCFQYPGWWIGHRSLCFELCNPLVSTGSGVILHSMIWWWTLILSPSTLHLIHSVTRHTECFPLLMTWPDEASTKTEILRCLLVMQEHGTIGLDHWVNWILSWASSHLYSITSFCAISCLCLVSSTVCSNFLRSNSKALACFCLSTI